ncbi:MAG: LysR substrate-binding domain-containing protein [Phenylobacterium sp.]
MPPLGALRAFEAAARHLNFTRAAEELCVTQGAVSRHIIGLEERLGAKLFFRDRRRLRLTPEGEDYARAIRSAFEIIREHTASLLAAQRADLVQITATPTLSLRWLMPRVASFYSLHPDIELQFRVSNSSSGRADFSDMQTDLGIEYIDKDTPLPGPGFTRELLFEERTTVVSHPDGVGGVAPPRDVSEIANYLLLTSIRRPEDWNFWLGLSGAATVHDRHLQVGNSTLVYQGARQGLGLAVAVLPFVEDDLKVGALVRPFPIEHRTGRSYVITIAPNRGRRRAVHSFIRWIRQEAAATCLGIPAEA